jgi:hypothetical protein
MTIPAFMSVSLDDAVADDLSDHVLFIFTRVRGANISELSAFPKEAAVCVPPPSVYRIIAVAKFRCSVIVTLERLDSPLSYLAAPAPQAKAAAVGGAAAHEAQVRPSSLHPYHPLIHCILTSKHNQPQIPIKPPPYFVLLNPKP